ncbi:hypothetical protein AMECASPLE_015602 [Ameca splendens]|uniref:Uncharacterized protein n=1 Tax=Ameca splendens TaxID=208324 RepID=A0ABV0ZBP4_9TELE
MGLMVLVSELSLRFESYRSRALKFQFISFGKGTQNRKSASRVETIHVSSKLELYNSTSPQLYISGCLDTAAASPKRFSDRHLITGKREESSTAGGQLTSHICQMLHELNTERKCKLRLPVDVALMPSQAPTCQRCPRSN